MCRLPHGLRTGPVTSEVVADSRDPPHQRAHGPNAGTVTTTHGLQGRRAQSARRCPSAFHMCGGAAAEAPHHAVERTGHKGHRWRAWGSPVWPAAHRERSAYKATGVSNNST